MSQPGCVMGNMFNCPNCEARYHLVKVEAGPESKDREITCRACGGPLAPRDGPYVLKYFLLEKRARPMQRVPSVV